jgi:hypothetical protein
MQDEKEQ